MARYDLIAFDLDGTVFGIPTKAETSERVAAAFAAAHEAGVAITVASGRPSWLLGEQLLGAEWLDWRILTNGARVSPQDGHEADFVRPIPRAQVLDLLAKIVEMDGSVNLHTQKESFIERKKAANLAAVVEATKKDAGEQAGDEGLPANPIDAVLRIGKMTPIDSGLELFRENAGLELDKLDCALPSVEATEQARVALAETGNLEIARLGPTELEISLGGVSKGSALGWLCEHLGIDETRACAFGDSGNDLSLAGRDATFVAMGNASREVKQVADDVCPTVWEDGVAAWIEEHVL